MKKGLLFIIPLLLKVSVIVSQQQAIQPCYTDQAMEEHFLAHPEARAQYEKTKAQFTQDYANHVIREFNNQGKSANTAAAIYTVPVVFHILHIGGAENISDAQIYNQMQVINEDYSKTNANIVNTVSQFTAIAADAQIVFKLATLDPNGNCTSGINRYYDVNTDWTRNLSHYIYTWNPTKYMNVYVVKSITNNAAGYTFIPGTAPSSAADAIVMLANYVGAIGTSNPNNSNTLTHEAGHWLNLQHVWGSNNNAGITCGDDGVTDTPITKGFLSCPLTTTAWCSPGIVENMQNYMDYSYCSTMFTTGQKTRMHASLNSAIAGRNNLSSPANLTATGVNQTVTCAPIANFIPAPPKTFTICAGQTLNLRDVSYNGTVTAYSWASSPVNTIAAPTASSTNITFPNVGVHTVSLTVSNAQGSNTVVKNITVLAGPANVSGAYSESFEGNGLPSNWSVINQTGGTTWQQVTNAASNGTKSYKMDGTINAPNSIDILETPSYDFLNNQGTTFTFKYAYARFSTATVSAQQFIVQGSNDCGGTWTNIYVPSPASMASGSGGTTTTPFTPTSTAQWKMFDLTTHPAFNYYFDSNVRFRFLLRESVNGFTNNLYLDEINFSGNVGTNELTKEYGFALFPNPASSSTTIKLVLSTNSQVALKLMDVSGRVIASQSHPNVEGEQRFTFNETASLSTGVYFVQATVNGVSLMKKLVVQH